MTSGTARMAPVRRVFSDVVSRPASLSLSLRAGTWSPCNHETYSRTFDGVERARGSVHTSRVPVIARPTERSNSPGVSSPVFSLFLLAPSVARASANRRSPSRARDRACRSRFSCAAAAAHETANLFLFLELTFRFNVKNTIPRATSVRRVVDNYAGRTKGFLQQQIRKESVTN